MNGIHIVLLSIGDEIRTALFPNLPIFIAHIIATFLLLFVIIYFGYKPFKRAQKKRSDYISKQIEAANKKNIDATKYSLRIKNKMLFLKNKEDEILRNSINSAELEKIKILSDARNKRNSILDKLNKEIHYERVKFKKESKKYIIDNAFSLASKIIDKNIDRREEKSVIDSFLKEQNKKDDTK